MRVHGEWFRPEPELLHFLRVRLLSPITSGTPSASSTAAGEWLDKSRPLVVRHILSRVGGTLEEIESDGEGWPEFFEWENALVSHHEEFFGRPPHGLDGNQGDHEDGDCECEACLLLAASEQVSDTPCRSYIVSPENFSITLLLDWPQSQAIREAASDAITSAAWNFDFIEMRLNAALLHQDGGYDIVESGALLTQGWIHLPKTEWVLETSSNVGLIELAARTGTFTLSPTGRVLPLASNASRGLRGGD